MPYLYPLVQNSITASVAIGVILVFRKVLINRVPMRIFIMLWMVVIFRLLVVHSISSPVSFQGLFFEINNYSRGYNENEIHFDVSTAEYAPAQQNILSEGVNVPVQNAPVLSAGNLKAQESASNFTFSLFMVWALGMTAVLMTIIAAYILAYLKTRFSDCPELILDDKSGVEDIKIYLCKSVSVPVAIGFIKPSVYLPFNFNVTKTELLKYVLLHEKIHIVRKDNLLKLIAFIALAVHWFNPFVWAMIHYLNRDIELSCDEGVIKQIGFNRRKDYADSLVSFAANQKKRNTQMILFASFGYQNLKERVLNIMKTKISAFFSIVLAITLTVCTFSVFAANASMIPMDSAISIALEEVGSGEVTKATLETKYGTSIYKVTIVNGMTKHDYSINAYNGEIANYSTKTINSVPQNYNISNQYVGAVMTEDGAKQGALDLVGSGSVILSETKYKKDGRVEYKVTVVSDSLVYKVESYGDGTLKKMEQESVTSTDPKAAAYSGNTIGDSEAIDIALEKSGGGTVVKCKLDYKKEGLRYEVKVINNSVEHKVKIDAVSGAIYDYSFKLK